jgi:cold shock CspA family protein
MEPLRERKLQHMLQGVFKWFDHGAGHGLITPDDGSRNLFVRPENIPHEVGKTLKKGDKVTYEVTWSRKGAQAKNVSKV